MLLFRRIRGPSKAANRQSVKAFEVPVVPTQMIMWGQKKLQAALRRSFSQDQPLAYGFVVHTRQHQGHPILGIITPSGESLALNERLLRALNGMDLWLFGHARIALGAGAVLGSAKGGRADIVDLPLASMVMQIATFETAAGVVGPAMQVEAVVKAEELVQPLLVLVSARPPGFPL